MRGRFSPRLVDFAHLRGREAVAGDLERESLGLLRAPTGHWHQKPHRGLRTDSAPSHLLLNRLRELPHERQAPRHPVASAVEPLGQLHEAEAQVPVECQKEPPLLEGRLRLPRPQRPFENQGLGFRQIPHRRQRHVATELAQRTHPLEPVDHHEAARFLRGSDDHDRRLLADLRERGQKSFLPLRAADPKRLVAKVELVKFQFLHRAALPSAAHGRPMHGSFRSLRPGNQTEA